MARVRHLVPRPIHQIAAESPDQWRADGSDPHELTIGPQDRQPAWRPDGRAVVFAAPGAKGPVSKTSGSASAGIDYEFGRSGVLPLIGVRFTHMLTDVAGVRWIAAPVVGIRF